ncbi:MAG: Rne/Rng family ribonuclease [Thermoanaerobaculaceae bacterium]|nr:Rne/Rng family ribonuclease [Thermoanaerobaculaceae bacterium]
MTTVIYCNVTPFETRVAVREGGALVELLVERSRERSVVGSLFKGRISRVLPGMQAAFVDIGLERDAFLYVDDVAEALEEDIEPDELATSVPIQDLLREGQEILVQITRELGSSKGPRATSHITIPGRYLVLIPGSNHIGISRRITDQDERERLRALLADTPHTGGVIVRTAGEGRDRADFLADLAVLESMWRHILKRGEEVGAPSLVHRDLDLVLRAARDLTGPQLTEFWVDDPDGYQRVVEFLDRVQPELTSRVKLYRRQVDIFEAFGIEAELQQALQPKVWLRSGGSIVINQTEALVAIDVNTGRYVGGADLEDTVCRTNLEAAREVTRQLRLRNLGGIIVVDFIDMEKEEHREQLLEALRAELTRDRARSLVGPVGPFGLVQLTRKRTERSLERVLTRPCPTCEGLGRVKAPETVCLELRRALLSEAARSEASEFQVRAHPEIVRLLTGELKGILDELRERFGLNVRVFEAPGFHPSRFELGL